MFLLVWITLLLGNSVFASFTRHPPPSSHHHPDVTSSRRFDFKSTASNADSSGLLYQVQEDLLTKQGQEEATLMGSTGTPLQANKPKGAGGGGGFGGGGSSKKVLKEQAKDHVRVLKQQGVVRIDNVLSSDVADTLKEFVTQLRTTATDHVANGKVPHKHRFADVLLRKNRADLLMPLEDPVFRGLSDVLVKSSVGSTIQLALGNKAVLYELSCLISDPGSDRQTVHPDTPYIEGQDSVLYTCFCALQDIHADMGPTCWLPETHTHDKHQQFQTNKNQLLANTPHVLGMLPKGCCAVYDSRILHCGTANVSDQDRALFYFSFKAPKVGYPGNPASIRPEVGSAQLTLKDLIKDLESYQKGKGCPTLEDLAARML